jgi:hypothetical protein
MTGTRNRATVELKQIQSRKVKSVSLSLLSERFTRFVSQTNQTVTGLK